MGDASGGFLSGFQVEASLWIWTLVVLLHGLWRSFWSPEADAVRPSGPTR